MFTTLCKMTQKDLKKFVTKKLKETHSQVIVEDGFVYAQGTFPVLLVAHLDTVHAKLPTKIYYNKKKDALSSPQGIGGDDRCGVYMILEIIKKHHCSVLFCEDEEIGAIGAEKFIKSNIAQNLEFNYILAFDRKGKNDAVFYDCDNEDFEKFITKDFYKTSWGSFSDISVIAPFLKCAAVNLSCGYYEAHTTKEYVVVSEMNKSIEAACKILARTTDDDKFEYVETSYNDFSFGYGDSYEQKTFVVEWYDLMTGEPEYEDIYAFTKVEAVGEFLMKHPTLSYNDIDIYEF